MNNELVEKWEIYADKSTPHTLNKCFCVNIAFYQKHEMKRMNDSKCAVYTLWNNINFMAHLFESQKLLCFREKCLFNNAFFLVQRKAKKKKNKVRNVTIENSK